MTTYYNHAFTIAFEVVTTDPKGGTLEERLHGLRRRLANMERNRSEAEGALMGEGPYDTYEMYSEADAIAWWNDAA
jgi:hypothetical protein